MSYSDLSVNERIEKAEEFCLLLSTEIKLPEEIIKELASTFSLTPQQANEAYINSKIKYKAQHSAAAKSKYLQLLVSLLVSICCGIFYFFWVTSCQAFF